MNIRWTSAVYFVLTLPILQACATQPDLAGEWVSQVMLDDTELGQLTLVLENGVGHFDANIDFAENYQFPDRDFRYEIVSFDPNAGRGRVKITTPKRSDDRYAVFALQDDKLILGAFDTFEGYTMSFKRRR
jgi:hypothetical protein